jgi:8-oxo-dGTP diphosphatase
MPMVYTYKYPRPAVTVDALVIAEKNGQTMALLIRRKAGPFKGRWALPGGFAGIDETLADACKRELEEETGISKIDLMQFYTFDAPDRDPREHVISVVFHGKLNEASAVKGGDDALEAKWFPLTSLPEMAFDHKEIIEKFIHQHG